MANTGNCPSQQVIQELVNGTLADAEADSLEQHLLECEPCSKSAETLFPVNEITAVLNQKKHPRQSPEDEAAISRLITQAKQLKPDTSKSDNQPTQTLVESDGSVDQKTLIDSGKFTPSSSHETEFLLPAEESDEIGRLGGYRVLHVLGSGGMGVVFRAEDPQLKRSVALKVMKPSIAANQEAKARFIREAQATAAIEYDHIVQIYQVGEDQNVPFIAMQFLQGESLQQRIDREGQLDETEVLRVGREIAQGLAAAHAQNLTHRDIKPDNIWLQEEQGRVKIVDFGLVRNSADDVGLTQTGVIMGTPRYMAPEQAQGKSVDHRGDLFSLGSVLYQLASGEPAFKGKNLPATLMAVAHETPQPVSELKPGLDPSLAALIMRLLEKDPEQRPQTALEVVETIEQIEAQQQTGSLPQAVPLGETFVFEPVSVDGQSGKGSSRRLWKALAGLAGAILLGVLIFKFATRDGTVVIELDGASTVATVEVDDKEVSLSPDSTDKRLTFNVDPGTHKLSIKTSEGLELMTNLGPKPLEIKAGGHAKLRAWVETSIAMDKEQNKKGLDWKLPADAPAPAIAPFTAEQAKKYQEEWAEYLDVTVEKEMDLGNNVQLTACLIPPGEFFMGSSPEEQRKFASQMEYPDNGYNAKQIAAEAPLHIVVISQPFYMGKYEFTRNQWDSLNGESASTDGDQALPAQFVSWNDCLLTIKKLNELVGPNGLTIDLPTEAEWEYACRAGTRTPWNTGHEDTLSEAAWTKDNAISQAHPVGQLRPNSWGLYDMHGNVWEWCKDGYNPDYYRAGSRVNPFMRPFDHVRVRRGGGFKEPPVRARSAYRFTFAVSERRSDLGLRVVARIKLPADADSWKGTLKSTAEPTGDTD